MKTPRRLSSRRITLITFLGLSVVSLIVGGMGALLLIGAIERSHSRLELINNAEYGYRFAGLLESELMAGKDPQELLRAIQATLSAYPGDGARYLCVLGNGGEVLCHPREHLLGGYIAAKFLPLEANGGTPRQPLSYAEWLELGLTEGVMLHEGKPVELIRRIPIDSTGWQVLVHTRLAPLMNYTRSLSVLIISIMVPTGVFFILLGTLVVRGIGRHYELQIEEANARLEERVETRTAELQQTVKELTATRRALDLSEKMALLGQLVAGIAHEINNPLNVIAIQAENVRELATDEDEKRAADSIRRSAVRCGQLVQNLLAFARNDPPRRQPESMNDLVETCLAMAAGESQRYGVRMDLEFPHGDVEVSIDRIQIEQVLLNLIGNAAQALAGQEGVRKVLVRVYEEDATAVIEVEDNGPGLPKVIRDNLFEPFQTTKLKGQGTGLGLSLCRRFVEGHGGRIVHSDRPGGGTIFRIVLPLALSARPAIVAG